MSVKPASVPFLASAYESLTLKNTPTPQIKQMVNLSMEMMETGRSDCDRPTATPKRRP
jgi:hypothetical protein